MNDHLSGQDALEPAAGAWQWVLADDAGIVIGPAPVAFADQQSAEDWLGDSFEDLQDQGVGMVSLVDGERIVYGPMYLAPDGPGPDEAGAEL